MDARQQVLQEIEALENQIAIFNTDLDRITATDPLDTAAYSMIKDDLGQAQTKLEAKRAELDQLEVVAQETQEHVASLVENIVIPGVGTLSLRDLTKDETEYQLAYAWFQQIVVGQAEKHAREVSVLKESYEAQIVDLKADAAEVPALRIQIANEANRADDAEKKRDAAGRRIEELDTENKNLTEEIERLRSEIADPKPIQTNINGNLAELARKALEAKPAVYNKRDQDRNNWVANLAETGEEVQWPKIYPGKYREVSEEEAGRFRNAQQEAQPAVEPVQADGLPDHSLVGGIVEAPEIQFQTTEVLGEIPAQPISGTTVLSPEELTRKVLELEQRMDQAFGVGKVA